MKHAPNANEIHDAELSRTERLCRAIAEWTGAPVALMLAIIVQLVWITVGIWTRLDPFPFVFLLTVSNVIQLILIFVIAVAQRQQSRHDQIRAETDHEALCRLLLAQEAQGKILASLAARQGVDVADVAVAHT
ncbi:DUF1003 domain-containing protein [Acidisphaera sp. L21]|jgi:uncharacterized membrane protein|uniref:DUF1003 domain-containing protein n=1 Tax=Acidisphaera sp. L21 TaxID=1641851 RepID=UPI00131C8EC0|nr:DUF1003 domain-containing protein [Acidisphaera sp. L21]